MHSANIPRLSDAQPCRTYLKTSAHDLESLTDLGSSSPQLDEDSLIRRQALQVLRLALPTSSEGATSAETGPWVERGADGPASTSSRGPVQKKGDKGGGSLNEGGGFLNQGGGSLTKGGGSRSKNEVRKEWKEFYQSRKRDGYAEKEMASMVEKKGGNGEGDAARWDAFLLLYENLDDYTLHLFEATWPAQVRRPSLSYKPPFLLELLKVARKCFRTGVSISCQY